MPPSNRRFIIVCPARSGSTMLVHLVRSHPDAVSNGEVMAINDSLGGFDVAVRDDLSSFGDEASLVRWRSKDPVDFMDTVAFHGGGALISGFKIKSDELVRRRYRSVLAALREDTSIKVLHLNRENLLERYVSWVMASRTGVTLAVRDEQVPDFPAVAINPRDCEDDFVTAAKRRALVDEWFADHEVLDLSYENLVDDTENESFRICDFLGLGQRLLETRTLKLAPHISTLVSNFDELAEYFAGTRWEHLFERAPADGVARIEPSRTAHAVSQSSSTPATTGRSGSAPEVVARPPFRIPKEIKGIGPRWGQSGTPFASYLASLADLPDLTSTRILALGQLTDMIESIANGQCAVGRYVGLEHSADFVDYCNEHLDDPRIELHHVAAGTTGDLDESYPDVDPFDLAVVREEHRTLSPERLDALLRWLRDKASDHARLVLSVPLAEPSSAGVTIVDRLRALADGPPPTPDPDRGPMLLTLGAHTAYVYPRSHLRGLLDSAGWRLDEVREPRRTLHHHVGCTAIG